MRHSSSDSFSFPNSSLLIKKLRIYQITTWILVFVLIGLVVASFLTGLTPERISEIVKNPKTNVTNIVSQLKLSTEFSQTQTEMKQLVDTNYVGTAPTPEQYTTALLKGYIDALGDQYSQYLTPEDYKNIINSLNASFSGIGIQFEYFGTYVEVQQVFANTPAAQNGLKPGDKILAVNDQQISSLGSADMVKSKITGPENTEIKLNILSGKDMKDITLARKQISFPLVNYEKQGNIGIVHISSFGQSLDKEMKEVAKKITQDPEVKQLILDLTNNTGGYLDGAIDLVSYFVEDNQTIVIDVQKKKEEQLKSSAKTPKLTSYPLVVTTNRFTASASEITAGALKDLRNIPIVGSKTYGKGVVQQIFRLKNQAALKLTIAEWLTPKRTAINKVGITPTHYVEKDEVKTVIDRYNWETNILSPLPQ